MYVLLGVETNRPIKKNKENTKKNTKKNISKFYFSFFRTTSNDSE